MSLQSWRKIFGKIDVSVRGNTFILPRMALGGSPDQIECPGMYTMPHIFRWPFTMMSMPRLRNWRTSFKASAWLCFHYFPKRNFMAGRGLTKADTVMKAVDRGLVNFHPEIKRIIGTNTVEFVDGTKKDFDKIILATGYWNLKAPWFPALNANFRKLYKAAFSAEMEHVGFVAYCRGVVGGVIGPAELQARWISLVISGKRKIPDREERVWSRDIDYEQIKDNHQVMRTSTGYCLYLAKHEVGCYPPLMKIFFP